MDRGSSERLFDVVARLRSGEILGELSFLDSRPPSASVTDCRAVVTSADLSTEGVHSGCACSNRAATPATCGVDMDVPDRYA